jgi:HK97 family phage major capsid protein/HK97 family phage prohead protease
MQLERLVLETKFAADDTGEIEGVAWDFSRPDRVGDVIEPKAFATAVGKTLPALFAHDQSQVVGTFDQITVEADGLHVKGRLLVDTVERAREVRSMIQAKAVSGLSIGFITRKAAPRKGGGRTIQELDLLETSIVAVPAHPNARITSQKDLSMTAPAANITNETENKAAPVPATPAVDTKALDAIQKRLDSLEAKGNRLAADNDNDDHGDVETKALNQWLRNGQVDSELKTLTVGTAASGGYTVAPEYSANVIKKIAELSPIRGLASVMSIGTNKVYIPTLASDAAVAWTTETGTRTTTEPTFGQIDIEVFEQYCVIPVSRQLLEDSMVDLPALLADRMAIKFAQAEASAFVLGDGSGKPTGLLNTPGAFEAVEADQAGSDILAKLIEAYYSLPAEYAARATWAMNRKTAGIIRAAADNASARSSIWSDGIAGGTPATLLGAPVSYWPDLEDVQSGDSPAGDTYPIVLADFQSAYQIVDRVGLDVMRDDLTGADTGLVKFRARRRVGGKPLLSEAAVVIKGAAA